MNARHGVPTTKRRLVFAFTGLLAVAGLAWVLFGKLALQPPGSHALRPTDARTVALGREVYQARCAACHGAQLQGQPNWRARGPDGLLPAPPHDASGHTWHHRDELLFRITKFGVAKAANLENYATAMPAFEGVLSDDEIVAALSWIKSRWPDDVRARHDKFNEQAPQVP
ncbi:cytochrome c [Sphaerotilus sp.]|uniref:c-type cytochrome n=1 Tax=Sphaerotilus sp. TaxID=2093942 RepID=UPI002ACE49AE|nr:cytochrome c [Sphaerotilus sp.]MDZ7855777.1 cytochrome c [Sphaerotilus sp.]